MESPSKKVENKNTFVYAFKQQIMKAWQPVPTIYSTICLFFVLGIFFLSFGIALILLTQQIVEVSARYDDTCETINQNCNITINIPSKMESPVFLYYEMENFYQNHRRYVKSRDVEQLKGSIRSVSQISDCSPITTMRDLGRNTAFDGTVISWDDPANPCGLIAKSFFNDTYQLYNSTGNRIIISEKGIAWPSDIENKFGRPDNWKSIQWTDVMDEHFIVWMRTAALSNFRKLWGKINVDLEPGTYFVIVTNRYDVSKFNGKKSIVLSTTNAFGGKNMFLSVAYLVVGSVCMLISLLFSIKKLMAHNKRDNKNK